MDSGRTFRNYTPEEVDEFLDKIIKQVEIMINDNRAKVKELALKDKRIQELESIVAHTKGMSEKLAYYEKTEDTVSKAIMMAQRTTDQLKAATHRECEMILEDAKKNASRIVNESLLKAEKAEMEANELKRNINIFKRKLRAIIQSQLDMVDDIEKVDF